MEPPRRMRDLLTEIRNSPRMNEGVRAMKERSGEFRSLLAASLVGVAIDPDSRKHFDDGLDRMWADTLIPKETDEIVIGSGLHAAVYCAVRVANGHPKPFVVEKARVGGTFAVSRTPTFYLNSRNRPGNLGTPGRGEALNVLPQAPIQPSDLSGDEYQRNSDLAFAIRVALAMNARVILQEYASYNVDGQVTFEDGTSIQAERLIKATGLGDPLPLTPSDRALTFSQFMARLDEPFPFRGMNRVAVIGAGDSGRTVIEALTGQGPSSRWSVASLDWVNRIDWYGVEANSAIDRANWEACNRSRYKGIGRLLGTRVNASSARAESVVPGYESVLVNGISYDYAIWCTGFQREDTGSRVPYTVDGRIVARQSNGNDRAFYIGPAAQIDLDETDPGVTRNIKETRDAIFRVDRTASLAASLPPLSTKPKSLVGKVTNKVKMAIPKIRIGQTLKIADLEVGEQFQNVDIKGVVIYDQPPDAVFTVKEKRPSSVVVVSPGGYRATPGRTSMNGQRQVVVVGFEDRIGQTFRVGDLKVGDRFQNQDVDGVKLYASPEPDRIFTVSARDDERITLMLEGSSSGYFQRPRISGPGTGQSRVRVVGRA